MSRSIWLLIVGVMFITYSCAASPATLRAQDAPATTGKQTEVADEEQWNVIYLQTARSGWSRSRTTTIQRNGKDLIRSEDEMYLEIKRFGQSLKFKVRQVIEETAAGRIERFSTTMENPPALSMRTEGTRRGDKLVVSTTLAGKRTTREIDWEAGAMSPAYEQRLLEANPLRPGDTRKMRVFVPDTLQFADVEIEAVGYETVRLLGRRKQKLLKIVSTLELEGGQQIPTVSYVDDDGNALASTMSVVGIEMSVYQVERSVALEKLAGAELDLGVSTLIKVKSIPRAHDASKIVYRITMPGKDPARFLTTGATQSVEKNADEVVKLTVTRTSVPPQAGDGGKEAGQEFTKPSQFLQSDDDHVIGHARKAVGKERDKWKQAVLLEEYVHLNLTEKNFSTAMASAAEVAKKLEGDCTEHAVLLAAMARAVGLPSRVAAGLVYVDRLSSFGGHMWTEVYINGFWIPLDATLGRGGIGAGHIKLSDSPLADDESPVASLLPLLTALANIKIEVLSVEHE